ncbi:hypothetical protein GLYMA_12G135600v4 [Glycine max]|nr:hypothetical protein GYH30_033637 [Glycine max]KRH25873.1 hypothetical protein GLYMA_12G135600v4 [Glycine max]
MRTYDVFVSFRGEDTRNNITSFLLGSLESKGIDVFKDNEDLRKGESIAPELLQAIEVSRIFVVVFSKNYASSTWCLRELTHICNCTQTSPGSVLPIFYDVDPSDVRKLSGSYEEAFAKYKERFREDREKMKEVQTWREALKEVGELGGWDIRDKSQNAEIEKIVQTIIKKLGSKFSSLPKDNLVGMESRVEELVKCLRLGSVNDVRVVGISGMSGIGKTELARALYERISDQFDVHCLVDDVSKIYQDSGRLGVQKQLLSQCLNEKNLEIYDVSQGTCLAWKRLQNAKALVVFDEVVNERQLQMFTGNRDSLLRECLGGGSRIIIISRDEHILRTHGVDDVYQVPLLDREEAVQLFCKNAFKDNFIMSGYAEFADVILSQAQGNPLAIKAVGSSLFGLNAPQWRSAVAKLREQKSRDIMDVLRISFDELDDTNKEIFLDIACFFNNFYVKSVMEILDFRGFYPEHGLQVLQDRSLIINEYGIIGMHGLLIDLGRCIVREKSPKEPSNWSRLWKYQDLYKIMSNNMAAEKLEAIAVDYESDDEGFHEIRVDALSKMSHLKLLKLWGVTSSGSLNHLSDELGYITWDKYPFVCLPKSFQPNKLVELCLEYSNIKHLWKDRKPLHNLRRLVLSHSKNLIELPDLGEALNLEWLDLKGCIKLKKINPSIGLLRKLAYLNLKDCTSLVELPHFKEDLNLQHLTLEGCTHLKHINPSVGLLRKLEYLILEDCKSLVSLPNSILCLNSLKYLSLYGCSGLYNSGLLKEPRDAELLKQLCIGEASTDSKSISSIVKRWFMWSPRLWYSRAHNDSVGCLLPSAPTIPPSMIQLDLSYCNLVQIPDAIGNLHCLEILNLEGNSFAALPDLKGLSKLRYLKLDHCKHLKDFPKLPARTDLSYTFLLPILGRAVELPVWGFSVPKAPNVELPRALGLSMFNCPELVEREGCSSMVLSWMIQIVQAHYQNNFAWWPIGMPGFSNPYICSVIPGSEIEGWFTTQHVSKDNLITIDPPPLMQHDKCIGVAYCVVFAAHSTDLEMVPPETERGYPVMGIVWIPVDVHEDVVTDKSDHLCLFYSPTYIGIGDWKLKVKIMDKKGFPVEVKKYGYRRVHEEDLDLEPSLNTAGIRKRKRGTDE